MAISRFSKRALALMVLFAFLAMGLMAGNQILMFKEFQVGLEQLAADAADPAMEDSPQPGDKFSDLLNGVQAKQWQLFFPIMAGVLIILALFFWGLLRGSARQLTTSPSVRKQKSDTPARKAEPPTPKPNPAVDQRLYLYLVGLLQREGRLVDFLFEDLSPYEDSQIGAAVRPIHASCRQIIQKALAPKPVMDVEEGAPVTVEAGFDPSTIKLTGQVSGEPPFQGTLQHCGWRAAKLEVPTLSEKQNPQVIAPAEVEIS